ncbi:M23 family metallopeptidase [Lichenibacterium dinghuense]|uniref:M23 family metallopeptidase n=1 Tax=Lichenibacterium dinghuense TaxID=2895977 RepID=UPI001F1B7A5E|nr:M23 family metallopeptidase [Lichenibacterium sp. 6Y81]
MKPIPAPVLLAAVAASCLVPGAVRAEVVLDWPVACSVGTDCEIQHYVDHGGGGDAKDYRCGTVTYRGHNGTDIRVPTLADERRGVAVLAAAPGRVLRVRDGMEDMSVAVVGHDAVKDRDCGNAVVIAHADGFETQYCHMAKGSVAVKPGDAVVAGQAIGRVGLSGDTEFPHLHITVRHAGQVVDPFAYGAVEGSCAGGTSLWRPSLAPALTYKNGAVLNFGLSPEPVTMAQVDDGFGAGPLAPSSPAVLAYVRAIDLRRGDVQRLVITGPAGTLIDRSEPPLPSNKDQVYLGVGRRRPPQGWQPGLYAADYTVSRDGVIVVRRRVEASVVAAEVRP